MTHNADDMSASAATPDPEDIGAVLDWLLDPDVEPAETSRRLVKIGGTAACQRCQRLPDECDCPRFKGGKNMECVRCGALQGQHLVDFNGGESVCP